MIDICYSFHALYSMHSWPFFELLFWVFAQVAPSLSGIEGFFMACFCPQPFRAKWIDCSIYQTKNWENKDTEAGMYIVGTIYLLFLRSHVDLPIKLFYIVSFTATNHMFWWQMAKMRRNYQTRFSLWSRWSCSLTVKWMIPAQWVFGCAWSCNLQ